MVSGEPQTPDELKHATLSPTDRKRRLIYKCMDKGGWKISEILEMAVQTYNREYGQSYKVVLRRKT